MMPADLLERKALTPGMMELLEGRGQPASSMNIIIAGGTGAGKTTVAERASSGIHRNGKERIVTIEDAVLELQLKQPRTSCVWKPRPAIH